MTTVPTRASTSAASAARSRLTGVLTDQSEDRGPEVGTVVGVGEALRRVDEAGEVAGDAPVAAAARVVPAVLAGEVVAGDLERGVAVDVVPGARAGVAGLVEDRQQHGPVPERREVLRIAPLRHRVAGRG